MKRVWLSLLLLTGCPEKEKPKAAPLQKPAPLEPLVIERGDGGDGDATFTVKPFTYAGEPAPAAAVKLDGVGDTLKRDGAPVTIDALKLTKDSVVVLSFDAETYLAQVTPLLAALDDAGAQVFLTVPDAPGLAWPVKLKDEPTFNTWLDETQAGKLRVVQRSDGFELQTNMGKLAGADAKGPTVPARGGTMDLVLLQKGLDRVKGRFKDAPDVCFLPTYGTTLHDAARAVATNWLAKDQVVFSTACLVYPRPAPKK